MPLTPGTRLAAYEVTAQLGEGGMGQVYRARDTKLNRDVALKILPDAFATDPDRLARFRREAQTLAALNHPNIAAIYGLEIGRAGQVGEDAPYLVMELVEGDDLSAHLARGAMPIADVLPIARQIAEALEAAHESGIVHRDLKPANITLRADGVAKVLDFGLAKAGSAGSAGSGGSAGSAGSAGSDHSPTITSPGVTMHGMILGTAAYMSPEQARGKSVDKRTDIWAFGCVVYEMLSGRAAFCGETISDTIAAILQHEPDWSALPAGLSSRIENLLRRCLTKDPRQRLRDIGDARFEIEAAQSTPAVDKGAANAQEVRTSTASSALSRAIPWTIAAGAATIAAVALFAPWASQPTMSPPAAPLRLTADLGSDASPANTGYGSAAILSPDGATLAFIGQKSDKQRRQLYVRPLAQLQATLLSDTEDAESPFFSPDGQWIAFFAGGKLKKIAVTGGAAVALCEAANGRGGAWSEDGTIVFSPNSGGGVNLLRVSAAGGKPEPVAALVDGEVSQRWPEVLPGGKAVLFTASSSPVEFDQANLVAQTLPSGPRKVVQRGAYYGRYLPSGHLLYAHEGSLFAVPFDLTRLDVTGPPARIVERVNTNSTSGGAQFAVSASGTLLYAAGQTASIGLEWMNREGRTTPLGATPTPGYNPQLSPDGRRLAVNIVDGQNDIWIFEPARDTRTRLTFDPGEDRKPVWTHDGRRIVFASARGDASTPNLYWQKADGSGGEQRLTESRNPQSPASLHPSGKLLAFEELTPETSFDLMVLPLEGDEGSGWKPGKPTIFLNTPASEREPMFSPDGRWLAYFSNETGRAEVYVRPFRGPGGKWQISTDGGSYPTWSRTKRELFYGTANGQLMVAPFTVQGDSFRAEQPRLWSSGRFYPLGPNRVFDLYPDGERFVLEPSRQTATSRQAEVTFVLNVFDELRRMAPATTR